MIGSSIPCFANEMFVCRDCGRNLGDRYSRLKGKKQPDVIIINGKHYCSKCADKHFNEVVIENYEGGKPCYERKGKN